MSEHSLQPQDLRVINRHWLSRADEAAAAMVLWDLKTEVSMPASRKGVVIQRLVVDWETGVYGLRKLMNSCEIRPLMDFVQST